MIVEEYPLPHRDHLASRVTCEDPGGMLPASATGIAGGVMNEQVGIRGWIELVRAEYREMPGMSLSKPQMQRLWGFDAFVCEALIDALVARDVLRLTANGNYVSHYRSA